jgi:hypothetical protein
MLCLALRALVSPPLHPLHPLETDLVVACEDSKEAVRGFPHWVL